MVLRNKSLLKNVFLLFCFGFAKQTKNKVYILIWVFNLLVERFNLLGKHKSIALSSRFK